MTILEPINTAQDLSVIVRPHEGSSYTVILRDKEQRTETSQVVPGTLTNGRLFITISNDFRDSAFYYMVIKTGVAQGDYAAADYAAADYGIFSDSTEEIYRGTIYTTTQTDLEKYIAVTNYEEPTQEENDFIVYEG